MVVKLSPSTLKGFHTYLRKHHASQEVAFNIWKYLKGLSPDFDSEKMEREYAYRKIFKGEPYNGTKLFNHLSDLYKLLSAFLLQEYLEDSPFTKDMIMMQVYKSHDLNESFFALHKKMEIELEMQEKKDLWNPLAMMYLSHEHYYYPETERVDTKKVKIQNTVDSLNNFYSLAKLKFICELYNRKEALEEQLSYDDEEEEDRLLRKNPETLAEECYQHALRLLKDRKNKDFEKLKSTLLSHQDQLDGDDKQIIISYLLNHQAYCIRKGDKVIKDALNLYKLGVEKHFFINGDCFEDTHFINIVDLARSLGDNDWAEGFIEEWKDKIEEPKREIVTSISKALVSFSRQNYQKVIVLLREMKSSNIHYEIRIRGLQIAAHYESEVREDEIILSLCTLYEQFIRRREIKRDGVFLYIKIIRKLLSVEPDKEKLKKELQEAKQFLYKNWLMKKIVEL